MAKNDIYVVIIDGAIQETVYSSLTPLSRKVGVSAKTLHRHFNKVGCYNKKGLSVLTCRLEKIKGRGKS